ncbi:MAG: hypothetical protein ACR2FY_00600 [Pirellulaceae bacterium]
MWYVALVFFVILGPLIFWLMWREDFDGMQSEWRYYRACKSRQPLSLDDFYAEFFASSGIEKSTIGGLKEIVAELYGVQGPLIRPEDNYPRIFDADDELIEAIEGRFGIAMKNDDLSRIDGSFNSIARYVQFRLNPVPGPNGT